jgi:N-ethylmaleimide reductase
VAFGRPVLANPDFVTRIKGDLPFNAPDFATFYTPGEVGYLDYPALATAELTSAS